MKILMLDRDGVINHDSDQYIKSPAEWKPVRGSIEAIARCNVHGDALHHLRLGRPTTLRVDAHDVGQVLQVSEGQ